MRLAVELSGEHPDLPEAEVRALAGDEVVERDERLLVVDAPASAPLDRLGLAHCVGEHLGSADDLDALADLAAGWEQVPDPFAVRVETMAASWSGPEIAERIGAVLGRDRTVDLQDPAGVVRVVAAKRLHAHLVRHGIDRSAMEARRPHKRPFDRPTSLHPRLARALVNLARPKEGVLDPFAGTGGILIEARSMGVGAVGIDREAEAVRGAARNLADQGLRAGLVRGDARNLPLAGGVDAVATDLPYGRSTRTGGLEPVELLEAVAEQVRWILAAGDRMVAVLPEPVEAPDGWRLADRFDWRVHRSLTRSIHVLVVA